MIKKTKDASVAMMTVKNSTIANLRKKVIVQKSITIAEKNVVQAVAKMDGPMVTKAYLVRSSRGSSPL